MILYPDGRVEGTPEEIARLEELRKAGPVTVPVQPYPWPRKDSTELPWTPLPEPTVAPPGWPLTPGITYGSGSATAPTGTVLTWNRSSGVPVPVQ